MDASGWPFPDYRTQAACQALLARTVHARNRSAQLLTHSQVLLAEVQRTWHIRSPWLSARVFASQQRRVQAAVDHCRQVLEPLQSVLDTPQPSACDTWEAWQQRRQQLGTAMTALGTALRHWHTYAPVEGLRQLTATQAALLARATAVVDDVAGMDAALTSRLRHTPEFLLVSRTRQSIDTMMGRISAVEVDEPEGRR
jgi:hypothetical protein